MSVPADPPSRRRGRSLGLWIGAALAVVALALLGLWFFSAVVAPGYTSAIVLGALWFVLLSVGLARIGKRRPELRRPTRSAFLVTAVVAGAFFAWTSLRDTEVNESIARGTPASEAEESGAGPEIGLGGTQGSEGEGEESGDAAKPQRDREGEGGKPEKQGGSNRPQRDDEAPGSGAPESTPPAETTTPPEDGPPARASNIELANGPVEAVAHSGSGRAAFVELGEGGRKLTLDKFEIDPGPQVRVYLVPGRPGDGEVKNDFKDLGKLKGNKGNQQYAIPDNVDLKKYATVVFWCVPFTQTLAIAQLKPA